MVQPPGFSRPRPSLQAFLLSLFFCSGLLGQQIVTSLSPYSADGQTVTVPIRITSAAGASALGWVALFVKADPAAEAVSSVQVNLVTREVQVIHEGNWTMWPLPTLSPGSASVLWGAVGKFEIVGYTFADPATTGNELRLDLSVKRYAPDTGLRHFTLGASATVAGNVVYSQP